MSEFENDVHIEEQFVEQQCTHPGVPEQCTQPGVPEYYVQEEGVELYDDHVEENVEREEKQSLITVNDEPLIGVVRQPTDEQPLLLIGGVPEEIQQQVLVSEQQFGQQSELQKAMAELARSEERDFQKFQCDVEKRTIGPVVLSTIVFTGIIAFTVIWYVLIEPKTSTIIEEYLILCRWGTIPALILSYVGTILQLIGSILVFIGARPRTKTENQEQLSKKKSPFENVLTSRKHVGIGNGLAVSGGILSGLASITLTVLVSIWCIMVATTNVLRLDENNKPLYDINGKQIMIKFHKTGSNWTHYLIYSVTAVVLLVIFVTILSFCNLCILGVVKHKTIDLLDKMQARLDRGLVRV